MRSHASFSDETLAENSNSRIKFAAKAKTHFSCPNGATAKCEKNVRNSQPYGTIPRESYTKTTFNEGRKDN